MNTLRTRVLIAIALTPLCMPCAAQSVRIKDIATVEGVRANQLVGYGLVIGLAGTGDSQQTKFTTQSLSNLLETYGISVPADKMKLKNVAAVMVTATLPAFARSGSTLDVLVSSLGDSTSLQGGTLLQTPVKAANGLVYAVAQGPLSIGGFSASTGGAASSKNHSTVGKIPGGAIVERETATELASDGHLSIALSRNDFTTAVRTARAIDAQFGAGTAQAVDARTVSVSLPAGVTNPVSFISQIESVEVTCDSAAKVVVNERTGTVIIGGKVRISQVAVSHGSLTVEVNSEPQVSQPAPLSSGKTEVVANTTLTVKEQPASLVAINAGATVEELVKALNALRVTPRDLIAILQAIKDAGALQADMEII
jgi:flagellar P-ring protein FlgI